MFDIVTRWLRHRREQGELNALGHGDLELLAQDIGISLADLGELIDKAQDPERLDAMLKALGIDEAALARAQPAMLRDMQRLCGLCEATQQCQAALESGRAADAYHAFCPNAETLDSLRRTA